MGIYVFTWKKLREYLIADEADPASDNDFGKNIIPAMLDDGEKMAAYRFEGYWKDVGTLDSLWDANMDMLSPGSGLNLLRQEVAHLRTHAHLLRLPTSGHRATWATAPSPRAATVLGEVKNSVLSYRHLCGRGRGGVLLRGDARRGDRKGRKGIATPSSARAAASERTPWWARAPGSVDFDDWGIAVVGPGMRRYATDRSSSRT